MVIVEVPPNPNCEPADMRVFHDLEAPRPVRELCLEQDAGSPAWYAVTGWTVDGHPCPAFAQRVDDSGDGVAYLIYGGDAGLRLQPAAAANPWRLDDARQWGTPFLLLGDLEAVR